MAKPSSLHDYLFVFMSKGEWWTYWDLSKMIQQHFGKLYNDNSISAAMRDFRKPPYKAKYNLPSGEVVLRRGRINGKGNEYKLITKEETNE